MTEFGFGVEWWWRRIWRMNSWMDRRMDRWMVGHDSKNGQERVVGQQGQVGQVRRVGTGGQEWAAQAWTLPTGGVLKTLVALKYGDPTKWIMFHGHLDYFQNPPLGGRPNTKPLGDHGTANAPNRWFTLFYHVWWPAWIDIHWNSIWLRARSNINSYYTWGSMTTLQNFGGVLGRPLDTFFWALTTSGHGSWLVCEAALISSFLRAWSERRWLINGQTACSFKLDEWGIYARIVLL